MEENDVVHLYDRVLREQCKKPGIDTSGCKKSLEISLDMGSGFLGAEHVTVAPEGEGYTVSYFGLYRDAEKTFLAQEHDERISKSNVLSQFKIEVENAKENIPEFYSKERKEIYNRMMDLSSTTDFTDAEQALLFFCRVFNQKMGN